MRFEVRRAATPLLLSVVLGLVPLFGCGQAPSPEPEPAEQEATATDGAEGAATTNEAPAAEETEAEAPAEPEAEAGDAAEDEATEQAVILQRVGQDGIGYVNIPETWVTFTDVDGNDALQWCDGTPYAIITLDTFDMETVPEDQREGFTLEDAASSIWAGLVNDGISEDAITGARVSLNGLDALQVYTQYPDGTFLVAWVVNDNDGKIRYASAEGPESTIYEAVNYVQTTYEL